MTQKSNMTSGDKPLLEPMLTNILVAIWHQKVPISCAHEWGQYTPPYPEIFNKDSHFAVFLSSTQVASLIELFSKIKKKSFGQILGTTELQLTVGTQKN